MKSPILEQLVGPRLRRLGGLGPGGLWGTFVQGWLRLRLGDAGLRGALISVSCFLLKEQGSDAGQKGPMILII